MLPETLTAVTATGLSGKPGFVMLNADAGGSAEPSSESGLSKIIVMIVPVLSVDVDSKRGRSRSELFTTDTFDRLAASLPATSWIAAFVGEPL